MHLNGFQCSQGGGIPERAVSCGGDLVRGGQPNIFPVRVIVQIGRLFQQLRRFFRYSKGGGNGYSLGRFFPDRKSPKKSSHDENPVHQFEGMESAEMLQTASLTIAM